MCHRPEAAGITDWMQNRAARIKVWPGAKKQHRGYLGAPRKRPDRLISLQQKRLDKRFASYPALLPIYEQMQRVWALIS